MIVTGMSVLILTFIVNVCGTPLGRTVNKRSLRYRGHLLTDLVQQHTRKSAAITIGGRVQWTVDDPRGWANIGGTLTRISQAQAYEWYTKLGSMEQRRRVLAPNETETAIFGTCEVTNQMSWPGNCERVEGSENEAICRVPATGVTERRNADCSQPHPSGSSRREAHPTERMGVAMVDGVMQSVTRAEAYSLYQRKTGAARRAALAPIDNDRVTGSCTIREQLTWPANCEEIADTGSIPVSACRVPSTGVVVFKTQGCINGDPSTSMDFLIMMLG